MPKSLLLMFAVIATTILFGYAGAALMATEAGRTVIGAAAALVMLATLAAAARILLPRHRDPSAY